jgi:hypothetical protein
MRPDDRRVDHIDPSFSLHIAERFEQRIENTHLDPTPEAAKYAIPFAIFVG